MRINGKELILESTATAWRVGDAVELAISPYPDVSGYQYQMKLWTPGGAPRGFMTAINTGARAFETGIGLGGLMATGGNADSIAWGTGFSASNVGTGIRITDAKQQAILLGCGARCGDTSDRTGRISIGGANAAYIQPNSVTSGLDIQMDIGAAGTSPGLLHAMGHNSGILGPGNSPVGLQFNGVFGTAPLQFAQLARCGPALEGYEVAITDGSTATFNAMLSGGGSNHVKAYCNGTNWTVH
jgi:hypothetical protein